MAPSGQGQSVFILDPRPSIYRMNTLGVGAALQPPATAFGLAYRLLEGQHRLKLLATAGGDLCRIRRRCLWFHVQIEERERSKWWRFNLMTSGEFPLRAFGRLEIRTSGHSKRTARWHW